MRRNRIQKAIIVGLFGASLLMASFFEQNSINAFTTIDARKLDVKKTGFKNVKKIITVGFVSKGVETSWYLGASKSVTDSFTRSRGFDLTYADADCSEQKQLELVNQFVQQVVDFIIVDPVSNEGWDDMLIKCRDAGIPVIFIDGQVQTKEDYAAWIGAQVIDEGIAAGTWYRDYANIMDIENPVVYMLGDETSVPSFNERLEGFAQVAKENDWQVSSVDMCNGSREDASRVMEQHLQNYGVDFNVVVCQHDEEIFGVIDMLEAAGVSYGKDQPVTLISFDASAEALRLMEFGKINGEFTCYPLHGTYCAKVLKNIQNKESFSKNIYLDPICYACDDTVKRISYTTGYDRLKSSPIYSIRWLTRKEY